MIDYKIIGKRIQTARLETKLTQEQLAVLLQKCSPAKTKLIYDIISRIAEEQF